MSKLTPTQQKILTAASARRGAAILPLPDGVTLKGGALKTTLTSLVKRGFVIERGKDKKPIITKAGRAAVGADAGQTRRGGNQHNGSTSSATIRPGTKQAQLLALLTRPDGAATLSGPSQFRVTYLAATVKRMPGVILLSEKTEDGPRRDRIEAAGA